MSNDQWTSVDHYIADRLIPAAEAQDETHRANAAAGLPAIDVSPPQGKFLHLLARAVGARKILEIGTLGGYSTIWLARALAPGGLVVTLENEPKHAKTAKANISREGVAGSVDLRVGPALELLPKIEQEKLGPFDLTFIDADKENNAHYFEWALRLSRPGSLIVIDNVVREGRVLDATTDDLAIKGTRAMFDSVSADPRVSATAIQTVGSKGWDGFVTALVL